MRALSSAFSRTRSLNTLFLRAAARQAPVRQLVACKPGPALPPASGSGLPLPDAEASHAHERAGAGKGRHRTSVLAAPHTAGLHLAGRAPALGVCEPKAPA